MKDVQCYELFGGIALKKITDLHFFIFQHLGGSMNIGIVIIFFTTIRERISRRSFFTEVMPLFTQKHYNNNINNNNGYF